MPEVKDPYAYPSRFGSHRSMVVPPIEGAGIVSGGGVVCRDEWGEYVTEEKRLDNGLADSNRYDLPARGVEIPT